MMKKKDLPMRSGWLWFIEGWKLFKKSPLLLILGALIWGGMELIFAFIPVVGVVIDGLIFPMFYAGFLFNAREIEEGRTPALKHFFMAFTDKTKFALLFRLGIVIVLFEVVTVAVGMSFGPIAVVILVPFVLIFISALLFSVPLVTFNRAKFFEALKSSYHSCGDNISAILMAYIVLFGLMVLSVITFGIALLVIIPIIFCSFYKGYKEVYG